MWGDDGRRQLEEGAMKQRTTKSRHLQGVASEIHRLSELYNTDCEAIAGTGRRKGTVRRDSQEVHRNTER